MAQRLEESLGQETTWAAERAQHEEDRIERARVYDKERVAERAKRAVDRVDRVDRARVRK